MDKLSISLFLVLGFTIYNCMAYDWVRAKPWMGVMGLLVTFLSAVSGFGAVVYIGLPWQVRQY